MNHADGPDFSSAIVTKPVLNGLRVNAAPSVSFQKLSFDSEVCSHFLPQ
jgi:hypothetical protein